METSTCSFLTRTWVPVMCFALLFRIIFHIVCSHGSFCQDILKFFAMEEDEHKAVEVLGGRLNSLNLDEEAGSEQKVKCEETESNNDCDKMAEMKAIFHSLIVKAKNKSKDGDFEESLRLYKKAYKIHKSEKILKRIDRLESLLQESNSDDSVQSTEDDGYVNVGDGFNLSEDIYNKLYAYQREGVQWFWKLFQQQKGGILGDDMGLGKTIQVISFLCGMFEQEYIKTALIIMPVSLLTNWGKEFKKWAPEIRVRNYHGSNVKQRSDDLAKIQSRNGVCLTTYGLANTCHGLFSKDKYGREFTWDYVILDEGHKIKNTANKTTQAIRGIPASNHFILTGTPIQNNLREMWALFDYVCGGKLLGTSRSFKQEYENPIVRARERDATAYEKRIGQEMSTHLRELIAPHFLRRTKAILEDKPKTSKDQIDGGPPNDEVVDDEESGETKVAKTAKLTRKNDLIIWVYLSETQLQIYKDFLELDRVKQILMTTRSPLAELNVLKKVCDHPRLLSTMACQQLGLSDEQDDDGYDTTSEWCAPPVEQLIQESGKMTFLTELLQKLKQDGHRTLVFSQSTKMLDIIQKVLKEKKLKTIRIDGSVTKIEERESRINAFQTDPSYTVFLLTTQVGGVGLTLTSADRVVIFDPSWNPATDAQAVDRVYRIGQKNTVVIYRLITCGSLEEKIYRKQVFKQAITKQTTGSSNNPYRYFTRHDLRDLFVLDDPKSSKTQIQLEKMHSSSRVSDTKLDEHVAFLYTTDIFGISDHDLLFSQEAVATQEELHAASEMGEVIQAKVRRAADIMKAESSKAPERRGPHMVPAAPSAVPKKKNQTKMSDHLEPFIPSREDSKRFMPKKIQPSPPTDVIDITLMDNEIDADKLGEQLSAITIKEDKAVPSGLLTKDPIILEDSDDDDHDVNRSGNNISGSEESLKNSSGEVRNHHDQGVVQDKYQGNTSHLETQPRLARSAHDDSGNDVTSATHVIDDVTAHQKVASEDSSEKIELTPVDEGFQENSSEDSIKENTSLQSTRSSGRSEMEDSGSDVNHPTHVIDDVITDERNAEEEDGSEKIKMRSVDKDYEEDTSEDSMNEMQASAEKDGLVQINTIDEVNREKRLSEGKKQSDGSTNDDTTDSDSEEERDGVLGPTSVTAQSPDARKVSRGGRENDSMYRSNDLDTSQESSEESSGESSEEDDDQDSESDDERCRKSERNKKATSGPVSNNDEVFVETNGQKKEFGEEKYGSPEAIDSDEEEFYDAKSMSEDVVMDSEEDNGNIRDSEDDEEIVEDEKVEDTDEEKIGDSEDDEVVDGEDGIVRDSEDEKIGDSVNEEVVEREDGKIRDSEDDEVVEGEYGKIEDSEDEKTGDSENEGKIQPKDRDGIKQGRVGDEGDERDYHDDTEPDNSDSADDNDENEMNQSDEMKTSDGEVQSPNADHSDSDVQSNDDSVNSQASNDDTEAIVPTKARRKVRQIISDDEGGEENDTGKENIPFNSSPKKFQEQARKPEEVVQSTTSRSGGKTTCCPRGKHVSDLFDIHNCPCVMSSEAKEAYKMHVNTGRRYEKSEQLKLALKHFVDAYKLCDSDERLRHRINQVSKAMKPRQ